jgi:hypothetical protein
MMLASGSALLCPSTALARRKRRPVVEPPPPPPPPPPSTTGHQYFLDSVAGSDYNAGTSAELPWRSLQPLHALRLLPGDTVYFKRGSTWTGGLRIDDSGQSGLPITFTSYGAGALPVFRNPVSSGHAISVSASRVVLEQVLVRDAYEGGVYIAPGANYNIVRQIEATAVGLGVFIRGQHNLISENYIHDVRMVVNDSGGDDDYGAVGVWVAESYNEISYNTIERCKAPSLDYGYDGGAIELYGTVNHTRVHHNLARDCEGFLEVGGGEELDAIVSYNLIRDTSRALHFNLGALRYASAVDGFRFENNTVVQASGGYRPINFVSGSLSGTQLTVRNNVFSGFRVLAQSTGFVHDHNLYSYLDRGALTLRSGEMVANPGFVNPGAGNFRLASGSAAVNAGMTLGYTTDLDGYGVPNGWAPDIGAYEYH